MTEVRKYEQLHKNGGVPQTYSLEAELRGTNYQPSNPVKVCLGLTVLKIQNVLKC